MIIKKVKLQNFRNFIDEEIELNPEVNVIIGKNAQGKTNFLESLYLFSSAKTYRSATEKDLIRFGFDEFKITMDFESRENFYKGEYKFSVSEKRDVKYNGISVNKNTLLSEYFKTVLFCPEEMEMIKGEKELRRNFLDDAICVLKPNYAKILKDYNKCIKQKNTLLKKGNGSLISDMLDIWNQRLAEYGSRLMMYRGSYINLLEKYSESKMDELTEGKEKLNINYVPSLKVPDINNVNEIKDIFLEITRRNKREEIERGQSLIGPHRDDIEFDINNKNAKLFGSQGQQRSVILCTKLAMTEIIKDKIGEYPVLLFDDILSELDKKRQSYLVEKIKGKQTIITCTGASALRKSKRVSFYTVENGKFSGRDEGKRVY